MSTLRTHGIFLLLLLLTSLASFAQKEGEELRVLWADTLLGYSSQYSEREFSANQAVGYPNSAPGLVDPAPTSWMPLNPDSGNEYVRLGFSEAMAEVRQIAVVESYGPGSIRRIYLESGARSWMVYDNLRPREAKEEARVFRLKLQPTKHPVTGIKIQLQTNAVEGRNAIDAVAISNSREPVGIGIRETDFVLEGERQPLPNSINSRYAEVHPVVSPDGRSLYFTRKKHPSNNGGYNDDIWVSQLSRDGRWQKPRNLDEVNTEGHDYLNGITPDGGLAMIASTREDLDRLFLWRKGRESWEDPKPLEIPGYGNSNWYSAFHFVHDARTLILSVDKPSGQGSSDLWVSFRRADDTDGTRWSRPVNLGADINTAGEETTPFLAADGKTLYFSSTGRYGYGRADIYVSKRLDDSWTKWSEPLNLGPTVNTPGWDANFTLTAEGDVAYFSSAREYSYTGLTTPEGVVVKDLVNTDIFQIGILEGESVDDVIIVKGRVLDRETRRPLGADILYKSRDGKSSGETSSGGQDGRFQIVLPAGDWFDFFAETPGYYAMVESINLQKKEGYREVERDILMVPIRAGNVIPLPSVSFEANEAVLLRSSFAELDRIAGFLRANPRLRIEIGGHTNDRCGADYCKELSTKRARAVMTYLISREVDPDQVVALGYGKEQPIADNSSAAGRSQNQRVEFKVLSTGTEEKSDEIEDKIEEK